MSIQQHRYAIYREISNYARMSLIPGNDARESVDNRILARCLNLVPAQQKLSIYVGYDMRATKGDASIATMLILVSSIIVLVVVLALSTVGCNRNPMVEDMEQSDPLGESYKLKAHEPTVSIIRSQDHQPKASHHRSIPIAPDNDPARLATYFPEAAHNLSKRTLQSNSSDVENPVGLSKFWVIDFAALTELQIEAIMVTETANAFWYSDQQYPIDKSLFDQVAGRFERTLYPKIKEIFGFPQLGRHKKITILITPLRTGAIGYYNPLDKFSSDIYPFSNGKPILYIGTDLLAYPDRFMEVLAHEMQHLIHFSQDPTEESWINEGLSELAATYAHDSITHHSLNLNNSHSLTRWSNPKNLHPYYRLSHSFFGYLFHTYQLTENLEKLVNEQTDGILGINQFLGTIDPSLSFVDVFIDWARWRLINVLDEPEGPGSDSVNATDISGIRGIGPFGVTVAEIAPFASHYFELTINPGETIVEFDGPAKSMRIPTTPPGDGSCWWSNYGDSIHSRMFGSFDLRRTPTATLNLSAWYNIEQNWDFAYISVSLDSGATWIPLFGKFAKLYSTVALHYGPGLSGHSNGWVQESLDLTPFTGQEILISFDYVTDAAINLDGLCVNSIAIPEIGFHDNRSTESTWTMEGFVKLDKPVRQYFQVDIMTISPSDGLTVQQLPLDSDNFGSVVISNSSPESSNAFLIISNVTPDSSTPVRYSLTIK